MNDADNIQSIHTTVLLHESIDGLAIRPGDVYLDGTLGAGGHAELAAKVAAVQNGTLTIVGLDQDAHALARTQIRLAPFEHNNSAKLFFIRQNYRNLDQALDSIAGELGSVKGEAKANRIMLDLGLSSDQFETSGRGFSFQKNEPLLMTFKENPTVEDLTARQIVNTWDEENIADIIYGYGEERYARKIAKGIVAARAVKPIETTFDLVDIIKNSTPARYQHGKIHPATRTFQALRITVNDEIGALKEGLEKGWQRLTANSVNGSKGRMAVISFHSIEDRIVKHFYKSKEKNEAGERTANIITKKPITASHQEISENPRSRSAKLRIIEKL
jgi:16S rRNA (cytosine1402-N4)-methyltransferase